MKSRLIFALSVALLFFGTSIFTYSQSKTGTTEKTAKQEVKQTPVKTTNTTQKIASLKTNTKMEKGKKSKTEKTSKMKDNKVTKTKSPKVVNNKAMIHHKKMDKKATKPETSKTEKK